MLGASVQTDDIWRPEIILPAQFFSPAAAYRPEKRLMLAVLQDAVATLFKHAGSARSGPRRLVGEVEQWISVRNSDWPFSFENICAVLNLDAAALREGLRRIGRTTSAARSMPVVALAIGRRVAGERHRVSVPRPHHRAVTAHADR